MKFDLLSKPHGISGLASFTYIIWVIATFLLEGWMQTLMRPEAVIDRITYTLVANIIIGIILALVVIRCAIKRKTISLTSAGFQPLKRTIIAVVVACILGIMVLFIQHPPSLDPVILLNVYAQVFTVTIAEIAVCWAVMGSIVEGALSKKGRVAAIISGIIFASVLFGVYHFAHSPPFNQPTMVLFLSVIGVVTSLVYFIGRDIYATMVFHNFFGSIWVMQSLSASGLLDTYSQPLYPVMGMAVISLAIFVIVDLFYVRKKPVTI
jgi:membrane protease YdiL (CAAX protease family)